MAQVQAARLNLRMQKELKLLLTDPPPGASFPSLSSSSAPSLTSIDARKSSAIVSLCILSLLLSLTSTFALIHLTWCICTEIEGPEGTVYAKGVFRLKIQIPDRYYFSYFYPPSFRWIVIFFLFYIWINSVTGDNLDWDYSLSCLGTHFSLLWWPLPPQYIIPTLTTEAAFAWISSIFLPRFFQFYLHPSVL